MRKLLSLFVFISSSVCAQLVNNNMLGKTDVIRFGTILDDSFARGSLGSDYTTTGGSWAPDGTDLITSGGAHDYLTWLHWYYVQCFEQWDQIIDFQFNSTPGAATFGIGVGSKDLQEAWNFTAYLDCSSGGDQGKVKIEHTNLAKTITVMATSSTAITVSSGQFYRLTLTRKIVNDLFRYTATVDRMVSGSSVESTSTYYEEEITFGLINKYVNATGKFTLWQFGGSVKVNNWGIYAYDYKNTNVLVASTSIGHGALADVVSDRYMDLLYAAGTYSVSAGASDRLPSLLAKEDNLLDYNADTYIIDVLTNDVAAGLMPGAMADLVTLVDDLEAAGKTVVLCYALPRNGVSTATYNSLLSLTFPGRRIINNYTLFNSTANLDAAYNSGDNIHPNAAGHALMASNILNRIGAIPLQTELTTLLNRGTTLGYTLPSSGCQEKLNRMIYNLKADGVWARLDVLYVFATDGDSDFATLNLINPSTFQATKGGSITFTTDEGFTPNGTSTYINTNFAPSSGTNYTQNSASFGGWINSVGAAQAGIDWGCADTGNLNSAYFQAWNTGPNTIQRINGVTTNTHSGSPGSAVGLWHNRRNGSNTEAIIKNGLVFQGGSGVSTGRSSQTFTIGAVNNGGVIGNFCDRQVSMWFAGDGLPNTEIGLFAAWYEYFSSL